MRNKSIDRKFAIGVAASLLVIAALAIEAPKPVPPPATAPQKEGPAEAPPSAPAAEAPSTEGADAAPAPAAVEEAEETLPPLPAEAIPAGPPPARFNPTEKVRADFPVSFPIDI
jgi:hypothetical protein